MWANRFCDVCGYRKTGHEVCHRAIDCIGLEENSADRVQETLTCIF